jgi:hypothetical protein
MNVQEFLEFMGKAGSTNVPPQHPFKHEWERIKSEIAPHFYGDVPEVLKKSFPNEDPEIMRYRQMIYQAKTESPMVKAITDLFRLLSTAKHAAYFDNERMQKWYNETLIGDHDVFAYFFSVVVPIRILDPNALFVLWPTGEGVQNSRVAVDVKFEIIQSDRVVFNDPDFPLIIYAGERRPKYTSDIVYPINGYYQVVTDEFYGILKEGVLEVIYEHKTGKRPWFTLGGRAIPRYRNENTYVVYKSDFSPAVPYLNDAAIFDNQHKSVMLSTCFPIKFLEGISCKTCNGLGIVADEHEHGKTHSCGDCSGSGRQLFMSPLAGYYLTPSQNYTGQQEEQRDPIRFYAPDTSTITLTAEQADKSLAKAEEVLNINRSIRQAQSGVAKELDREPEYIEIGKISDDVYAKLGHTLECVQALVFTDTTSMVTVVAPVSFDLKTEVELMQEFAETQKGMPADIRYNAYFTFISQRFANDTEAKRIAELCVQYSSFILYTIQERSEMVAAGQMTQKDSIKAANVFDVLMMLVNSGSVDIYNQTFEQIKVRIDAEMEARFEAMASALAMEMAPDDTDTEEDPTL